MLQHIIRIAIAGFIFWLMVLMTLDVMHVIDLQIDAPYLVDVIKGLPKLFQIIEPAHAASTIIDHETGSALVRVKVVVLPDFPR
ncbi:hypothetical protein GAY31_11360 [Azospirillum brasilense]|nr:hypothetical protein [Azospirillum brasilense]